MTVIDSAAKARAQKELQAAVDALTLPVNQIIEDHPPMELPCLLDQLTEAIESSSGRGGAARSRQSAPLALDVVILLAGIDRALYKGLSGTKTVVGSRPALMRTWAAQSGNWRANAPAYLVYAAGLAAQWLVRAKAILSGYSPTREPHGASCPHCGATTVFVPLPEGDVRVQRSALYLDTEQVAVICRACGDTWETGHLNFLAAVLEDIQRGPSLTEGHQSVTMGEHR